MAEEPECLSCVAELVFSTHPFHEHLRSVLRSVNEEVTDSIPSSQNIDYLPLHDVGSPSTEPTL